jgi:Uma2 family endonuclease
MTPALAKKLSLEDFLAWEEKQSTRNEFVDGETYAMVGGKRVHGEVVGNLFAALHTFLRGKPCRVYAEGLKLQVKENIFYPDIFVTCSKRDLSTERIFTEPKLIVEVYSESTGSYDRGTKFSHYRALSTLEEYVIVEPESRRVEVFRRQADGVFGLYDYTDRSQARFASIDFDVELATLFENVEAASE